MGDVVSFRKYMPAPARGETAAAPRPGKGDKVVTPRGLSGTITALIPPDRGVADEWHCTVLTSAGNLVMPLADVTRA